MSDLRQCSREFISEFIDLYRENTCLWKVKSSEYVNRDLKRIAYEKLREKLLEVDKNASTEIVKKKINSLRNTFRVECKKVENSLKSGAANEDVYKPTLWYYDLLQFLRDQEMHREGVSSRAVQDWSSVTEEDTFEDNSTLSPSSPPISVNVGRPTHRRNLKNVKRTNIDSAESVLEKVGKKLDQTKEDDDCDIFGKNVACKLRKLSDRDKLFAEKIINDALFQAQLGKAEHMEIVLKDKTCNNAMHSSEEGLRTILPTQKQVMRIISNEAAVPTGSSQFIEMPLQQYVMNFDASSSEYQG